MKKVIALIALLFLGSAVFAVNGVTVDPSRTLFPAREVGMGGVALGFSDDSNGVFSNPAGLTDISFPQLSATSRKIMLDETQYTLGTWAFPTVFGIFGIGYTGMVVGDSFATSLDPGTSRIIINPSLEAGSYSNSVMAFSYARTVPLPLKTSVGGTLKLFNQSLSGAGVSDRGTGMGIDLSLLCRPLPWLSAGAVLQNIVGGNIKWNTTEDKIGGLYKLGAKFNLLGPSADYLRSFADQKLFAGLDLDFPGSIISDSNSMRYHAGIEYFPFGSLALRSGFGANGLAFGVGILSNGFRFDYGYSQRPSLPGDTPHYVSLSYIGERTVSYVRTLKGKKSGIKFMHPHDRFITNLSSIEISAEAKAARVMDEKTIYSITAISETVEVKEVIEEENLQVVYLNGIKQNNPVDIKTSSPLGVGRNVFQLVGYTTPEAKMVSSEVRVLRIRPFSDASMQYWAIEPIALCVTLNLAGGYPDGTFKPEKGITRTELATMLARTLLASREESTAAAKQNNKVLTRAEAITLITRYLGISEDATAKPAFADIPEKFWGNKYITPAAKAGLLKYLSGKKFEPSKQFTRAEACEVLYQTPQVKARVENFWDKGIASFITQPTTKEAGVKKLPITPSTYSITTREATTNLTKEAATLQSSREVK
jgi:hypothetical protein